MGWRGSSILPCTPESLAEQPTVQPKEQLQQLYVKTMNQSKNVPFLKLYILQRLLHSRKYGNGLLQNQVNIYVVYQRLLIYMMSAKNISFQTPHPPLIRQNKKIAYPPPPFFRKNQKMASTTSAPCQKSYFVALKFIKIKFIFREEIQH